MSSFAKFEKLASIHRMTVDYIKEGDFISLDVWSPRGFIFQSSGCHCDCSFNNCTTPSGRAIDWPTAYKVLQVVVSDGLFPCEDGEECEYCNG